MLHIDSDKFQEIASPSPGGWQILIQPSAKGLLSGTHDVNVFVCGDLEPAVRAWLHLRFSACVGEFGDSIKLTINEAFGTKMEMHVTLSQLMRFVECMTLESANSPHE